MNRDGPRVIGIVPAPDSDDADADERHQRQSARTPGAGASQRTEVPRHGAVPSCFRTRMSPDLRCRTPALRTSRSISGAGACVPHPGATKKNSLDSGARASDHVVTPVTVTDGRNARRVSWPLPVLLLVIAFTSIPTELRPVSRAVMHEVFDTSLDIPDILANVIGFIPLGVVLAARGARSAIGIAACVSIFAETTQLFSLGRSPSLIDVATNVIGAALGVAICARWNIRLAPLLVTRPIAAVAAVLAIAYAGVGAQIMPNDVENALAALMLPRSALQNPRGATAPGRLEARWTFDRID